MKLGRLVESVRSDPSLGSPQASVGGSAAAVDLSKHCAGEVVGAPPYGPIPHLVPELHYGWLEAEFGVPLPPCRNCTARRRFRDAIGEIGRARDD